MGLDMSEHPEDMRYSGSVPPDGVCQNRYCPEPIGKRDDLVRGYCPPCAAIRRPVGAVDLTGTEFNPKTLGKMSLKERRRHAWKAGYAGY